ncbi:MAG: hypothetical protein Kow0069_27720 [Promethearchaeota archaeon]
MAERERPSAAERVRAEKVKRMEEIQRRLRELEERERSRGEATAEGVVTVTPAAPEGTSVDGRRVVSSAELPDEIQALEGAGAVDEFLDPALMKEVEAELAQLEKEVAEEKVVVRPLYDQLVELYPWLAEEKYAFMFSTPPDPKSREFRDWLEDWGKVVFDYARLAVMHVLYVRELMGQPPFSNFRDRDGAIRAIAEHLVAKKLASWVSRKKEGLRVYWKTLEEWADEVFRWARDNALVDPVLLDEFAEAEMPFSTLPADDWKVILKILKKKKLAQVVPLSGGKKAVQFSL